MVRASIFSFALLIGAGPSLSLLCVAWCPPAVAVSAACHHGAAGAPVTVTAQHDCREGDAADSAILPGDIRRLPATGPASVDAAEGMTLVPDASAARLAHRGLHAPPVSKRPLTRPLRV